MEPVDVGILSLLPPIIAISLALVTKEVISSLMLGILSGGLIYAAASGGGLVAMSSAAFEIMSKTVGTPDKFNIILFLALLGALVCVVNKAGGSQAYGQWATRKITSRRAAELATSILGILIFIDDYFNCLTVGTVMKPVTDKYRISRAKLAYIIDTTAAPICIIAPISSWAAAVGSTLYETGAFPNEMSAFFATIPYNMYAILSILMVTVLSLTDLEFGPMAKVEYLAETKGELGAIDQKAAQQQQPVTAKGTVYDLLIPIAALIVFTILAMLYNGGYWSKGLSFQAAIGNSNSSAALVLGGFWALLVAFFQFVPRKLLTFRQFMDSIGAGINTMVPAYIILTLAWTIGTLCQNYLGTGKFIGMLVQTSHRLPGGRRPVLLHRHRLGHLRTVHPHCSVHLPVRHPHHHDRHPVCHPGRLRVRGPLFPHFRYHHPVLFRGRLQPHPACGHPDPLCLCGGRLLLRGLPGCRFFRRQCPADPGHRHRPAAFVPVPAPQASEEEIGEMKKGTVKK